MRSYIVVGLDFSLTSPGMSAIRVNEDLTLQLVGVHSTKTNSKEKWFTRVERLQSEITKFVHTVKPKNIFIENYSFGSTNGRETAGEVHGICMFKLIEGGFPEDNMHRNISPQGLKKFVTGKGNADKEDMVDWANERFNLALKKSENDIADAIALAYMGIHLNHYADLKHTLSEPQIEAIENILYPKPKKKKTKKKPGGNKK